MTIQNSASLIADAVEVGVMTDLDRGQRNRYEDFVQRLRRMLEGKEDALLAFEKLLRKPDSKGAKILLEEELSSLSDSFMSDILPFAKQFLEAMKRGASDRVIITGGGNYIGNISTSRNLVIGDVSSNFQSVGKSSSSLELTGQERKQLREALLSAFPSESDLRYMMYDYFELDLNQISHGGTYQQTVFELVRWAESNGKIRELLMFALEANPGNSALNTLIAQKFPDMT